MKVSKQTMPNPLPTPIQNEIVYIFRKLAGNDVERITLIVWPPRRIRLESALFVTIHGQKKELELGLEPYAATNLQPQDTLLEYDFTKAFHSYRKAVFGDITTTADGEPFRPKRGRKLANPPEKEPRRRAGRKMK